MIQITTNQFNKIKDAEIDGHIYHVRKLGAGEALDISQISEQMQTLRIEIMNNNAKMQKSNTNSTSKQESVVAQFRGLLEQIESIYAGLFDDGGDGTKSKELIRKVGIENMNDILSQIFGDE